MQMRVKVGNAVRFSERDAQSERDFGNRFLREPTELFLCLIKIGSPSAARVSSMRELGREFVKVGWNRIERSKPFDAKETRTVCATVRVCLRWIFFEEVLEHAHELIANRAIEETMIDRD